MTTNQWRGTPVLDKLDGTSAVVEAVSAIEVDDRAGEGRFSPFGRGDTRGPLDQGRRTPVGWRACALRILVPVLIDA